MKLVPFVNQHVSQFGNQRKAAQDFATLLDSTAFDVASGPANEERTTLARARQSLFEVFCAVCVQAGLPAPELERETIQAQLPSPSSDPSRQQPVRDMIASVRERLAGQPGGQAADDVAALLRTVELLPGLMDSFGSSSDTLMAMLNSRLMDAGLQPLRPNHATMTWSNAASQAAPARPLRVLIVDDSPDEVIRTFRAIVGWPGLDIEALVVTVGWNSQRDVALQDTARAVIERQPDVVLMDQGIGLIRGSDVILKIRQLEPEAKMVFVGNTGGSPEDLEGAGAIGNMSKGCDLWPFKAGLRRAEKI